jgi:hypothetical protein
MKIVITTPDFSVHGGIRIILEWANRLCEWHEVFIFSLKKDQCNWFPISDNVSLITGDDLSQYDCIIFTSPHSVDLFEREDLPNKQFLFLQMAEHLFRGKDPVWLKKCRDFYTADIPMFLISKWNAEMLKYIFGRSSEMHYIGNGVNMEHFPIASENELNYNDGKIILIEGWGNNTPAKDPDNIAPRVAKRLKREGYRIVAYTHKQNDIMPDVLDELHIKPSLEKMNALYASATILLKATKYDARSCSPMEAMTKGTVTARAIDFGDDDLIHEENCLRCEYSEDKLYDIAKRLLTDGALRNKLSYNCIAHVTKYSWKYYMPMINKILSAQ